MPRPQPQLTKRKKRALGKAEVLRREPQNYLHLFLDGIGSESIFNPILMEIERRTQAFLVPVLSVPVVCQLQGWLLRFILHPPEKACYHSPTEGLNTS
jgi:hypothetical protein